MQSHTNVAMQSLEKRVQKILQKLTANPNPFQIASAIHDFDLLTLSIAQNPLLQGPKTAAVMQPLVDRFAEIAREAAPGLEEKDAGPGSTARDPQLAFDICMALGRYSLQRDAKKWENDGLHVADAFAVAANIALKTPALFEDLADGTKLFLKAMHYLGKDMVGFPEGYKPSDCFPQSPVQIQDILPDHRVVFLLDAAATATSSEAGTIMNHWRSLPLPILLTELGRYTLERVYGRRATEGEMIRCLFGIRTEVNLVNLRRAVELSRDDMDGRDIFLGPLACNIAIKNLVPLQSHLAKPWIVDACNAYKESLQRFNDKFKMLGTHQFFCDQIYSLIAYAVDPSDKNELIKILLDYLELNFDPDAKYKVDFEYQRRMLQYIIAHPDFFATQALWHATGDMLARSVKKAQSPEVKKFLFDQLHTLSKQGERNPDLVYEVNEFLGRYYYALYRESQPKNPEYRRNAILSYETAHRAKPDNLAILMTLIPILLEDPATAAQALPYCKIALSLAMREWNGEAVKTIKSWLPPEDPQRLTCEQFVLVHDRKPPLLIALAIQNVSDNVDFYAGFRKAWITELKKDIATSELKSIEPPFRWCTDRPGFLTSQKTLIKELIVVLQETECDLLKTQGLSDKQRELLKYLHQVYKQRLLHHLYCEQLATWGPLRGSETEISATQNAHVQLLKSMHDGVEERISGPYQKGERDLKTLKPKFPHAVAQFDALTQHLAETYRISDYYKNFACHLRTLTNLARHPHARGAVLIALSDKRLAKYLDLTRARALFANDYVAMGELYNHPKINTLSKLFYGHMYLWLTMDTTALQEQYPQVPLEQVKSQRAQIEKELPALEAKSGKVAEFFHHLEVKKQPIFNAIFYLLNEARTFATSQLKSPTSRLGDNAAYNAIWNFLKEELRNTFSQGTKPWVDNIVEHYSDNPTIIWPRIPAAGAEEKASAPQQMDAPPLETSDEPAETSDSVAEPAEVSATPLRDPLDKNADELVARAVEQSRNPVASPSSPPPSYLSSPSSSFSSASSTTFVAAAGASPAIPYRAEAMRSPANVVGSFASDEEEPGREEGEEKAPLDQFNQDADGPAKAASPALSAGSQYGEGEGDEDENEEGKLQIEGQPNTPEVRTHAELVAQLAGMPMPAAPLASPPQSLTPADGASAKNLTVAKSWAPAAAAAPVAEEKLASASIPAAEKPPKVERELAPFC